MSPAANAGTSSAQRNAQAAGMKKQESSLLSCFLISLFPLRPYLPFFSEIRQAEACGGLI